MPDFENPYLFEIPIYLHIYLQVLVQFHWIYKNKEKLEHNYLCIMYLIKIPTYLCSLKYLVSSEGAAEGHPFASCYKMVNKGTIHISNFLLFDPSII